MKTVLSLIFTILFLSVVPASFSEQIPNWIKNDSISWINDDVSDADFLTTIQFLLNNNFVSVDISNNYIVSADIPKWLKTLSSWWINDDVSDSEFLSVIEYMVNEKIILSTIVDENKISSLLISWDELVDDAKYGNDGSLTIKNNFFKNSDVFLTVPYNVNSSSYYDHTTFDLLDSGLNLYQITKEDVYLDQARSVADSIESTFVHEDRIWAYAPYSNTLVTVNHQELLMDVAFLSSIDSKYVQLTKKIADRVMEYELDSNTNLFYSHMAGDGSPILPDMYMSYGGSVGLESLLLAYELTEDKKYLDQVKQTLLSYWDLRNTDTNLIPSSVLVTDSAVKNEFMQQYGAGIFLKILLHYYYLTNDSEIFTIMTTYHDAVIEHFWDGHTWDYRVNYDGSVSSPIIEGNYAKLDDSLILLHDLNPDEFDISYDYAKNDYDNSFESGIGVTNNLVIHSVTDDGVNSSRESMMQYGFLINQNVGSRLFHDTHDVKYLESLNELYHSTVVHHKRELGYVYGIDAYALVDTELGFLLNQRSPGMIANKINLLFMPLNDVKIIWTTIGNYEITEPFISTFNDSGRFNSIDFDYEKKSIFFHTVYNSGKIIFADEIDSVLVNGNKYYDFESHTLNTIDGKNDYLIFLK
jgi:hypothetical protein